MLRPELNLAGCDKWNLRHTMLAVATMHHRLINIHPHSIQSSVQWLINLLWQDLHTFQDETEIEHYFMATHQLFQLCQIWCWWCTANRQKTSKNIMYMWQDKCNPHNENFVGAIYGEKMSKDVEITSFQSLWVGYPLLHSKYQQRPVVMGVKWVEPVTHLQGVHVHILHKELLTQLLQCRHFLTQ